MQGPKPGLLVTLLHVLGLAVAYVLAAQVGQSLTWVNGFGAPFWPPTGVALAALVLGGRRLWPGVALGGLVSALLRGGSPLFSLAIASANALEPLLVAWLLEKSGFRPDFDRLKSVLSFLAASIAGAALSATLGVSAVCIAFGGGGRFWEMWRTWLSGNLLGAVLLATLLISWRNGLPLLRQWRRALEAAALLVALVVVCKASFSVRAANGHGGPAALLLFPLQTWAAIRFGPRGSIAAALLAGSLGIAEMHAAMAGQSEAVFRERLVMLQAFIATFSLSGLVLAAIIEERLHIEARSRLLLSAIGASQDGVVIGEVGASGLKRLLYANEAGGRLLGRSTASLLATSPEALFDPGGLPVLSGVLASELRAGKPVEGETRLGSTGGDVDWQLSPVLDDRGLPTHFVAVLRDVTSRRTAERKLRWSEALLRATTAAAPFGLYAVEAKTLRILFFNQRFVELLGLADLEADMRSGAADADAVVARFLPQLSDRAAFERHIAAARASTTEPLVSALEELELKDGRVLRQILTRILGPDGDVLGRLMSFEDITVKRQAQAALARSHERYRALVSGLPDTLVRVSGAGIVLDAFSPDQGLLNDVAAAVGKPLREALPGELATLLEEAISAALAGGGLQVVQAHLREGAQRDVEARVVKCGADEALATLHDVTEHRQLQAKLLLSDRMASVGTLAAGVAHEINNPLSFVIANQTLLAEHLETLRAERPSPLLDECAELLRESADGTDRVRRIVRDLKIFARGHDEDTATPVDLRHALDRAIALAWNELRHKARLVKQYGEVPKLAANEARLGQVFLNLLVNAAQAIPEGNVEGNEIRVSTRVEGGFAVIEVRDSGSGIPAQNLARIFDPFFTTKPVGVGTGLGLAVSHQIVTAHGGEIAVESAVGKGTLVRIHLPLGPARDQAASRASASGAPPAKRRGSVLVIDDEALLARSLQRLLSPEHEVETAGGGRQALALIENGKRFDVILCDLMMPEVSGMDLHAELQRSSPNLAARMVFLTGGAFTPSAREFLERVPNPRLEKPFNLEELKRVVRTAASVQPS